MIHVQALTGEKQPSVPVVAPSSLRSTVMLHETRNAVHMLRTKKLVSYRDQPASRCSVRWSDTSVLVRPTYIASSVTTAASRLHGF